jgi:hypothetical protein
MAQYDKLSRIAPIIPHAIRETVHISSTLTAMAEVDFKQANERYAANFGDNGELSIPPSKHLVVGK